MLQITRIHDHLVGRGYDVVTVRELVSGGVQVVLAAAATTEQLAAAQAEAEAWQPTTEQRTDDQLAGIAFPPQLLAALVLGALPDATASERAWALRVIGAAGARIRSVPG